MNKFASIFAALGAMASALAFYGCQCNEDTLDDITRRIEFYHVGEQTNCSVDTWCKTSACKACTTSKDCSKGEMCMGPFNTVDKSLFKLNFGRRAINRQARETVRINNLTEYDTTVISIAFKDGTSSNFTIENPPAVIPKNGSAEFTLVYQPLADKEVDKAVVMVETKSSTIPHAQIEVYGEGTKSEAILHIEAPSPDNPEVISTYECYDTTNSVMVYIEFGNVPLGAGKEVTAKVSNFGPFKMNVTITPKSAVDSAFAFVDPAAGADGKVVFSVDSMGEKDLKMSFNPIDTVSKITSFTIETNDSNCTKESVLSLHGRGVSSVIQVCGESNTCPVDNPVCNCTISGVPFIYMSFGNVEVGKSVTRKLEISNLGDIEASITKLSLKKTSENYTLDQTSPPAIKLGKVSDENGKLVVNVTYSAKSSTNEENEIEIEVDTGSGKKETYQVELKGASQPQICVAPEATLVYKVEPSKSETQPVIVTNCGYADLVVSKLEIINDPPSAKSYVFDNPPAQPFTIKSGNTVTLNVKFTNDPTRPNDTGTVYFHSNDPYYTEPDNPYILNLWSDDNTEDKPPVARIVVPGGVTQEVALNQLPLNIVVDGSTSSDDKGIASYNWKLVFIPQDSTSFMNSADQVLANFDADKCGTNSGKYIVQLTVTDTIGQVSLPTQTSILVNCKAE
jgi:hypothetical protein